MKDTISSRIGRAKRRRSVMENAFAEHAASWSDHLTQSLIDPLLFEAVKAAGLLPIQSGYQVAEVQGKKAAELLNLLPEDKVDEAKRARKELPLTRQKLWRAALQALLYMRDPKYIAAALLRSTALSQDEKKILKDCLRKRFETLNDFEADALAAIIRQHATIESNEVVVRGMAIGIAQQSSLSMLLELFKK